MTSIQKVQQIPSLSPANLPQDDARRMMSERSLEQLRSCNPRTTVYRRCSPQPYLIRMGVQIWTYLNRVLDDNQPLTCRNEIEQGLQGGGLPAPGSTRNQDVLPSLNRLNKLVPS